MFSFIYEGEEGWENAREESGQDKTRTFCRDHPHEGIARKKH